MDGQPGVREFGRLLSNPGSGRAINVVRDRYRRHLLRGLRAGRVDHEDDVIPRSGDQENVRSELREVHLPMLEEAGIIEWDRKTGEISKGPNFDEIEPLLALMDEHADELPPFWP